MQTPTAAKRIKITLTNRAPVTIDPAQWGTIANAGWYSGQYECQANEIEFLRVRRHADGRVIVYGVRESGPGGMPMSYVGARGGELVLAGRSIAAAIQRVGESIDAQESTISECIAALPAEEL